MKDMIADLIKPGDLSLSPGEARCPGPSVAETLAREDSANDAGLMANSYEFLGDQDLSFSRYTSQAFYDQEMSNLWSKTWQWACREEHIPKPGDYQVYDIGHYSAMVIRGMDGEVRAFVNSCPHRGMQFADAGSSGTGKQFLRCPFHGMSWHLDGSLKEIPCRWDFPHVEDDEFGLTELPSGIWGGFVFVNFDLNCGPLEDFLEVLPEHFKDWGLEDRYVAIHTHKELPGNWKMCMEGFLEAFHVLATHPEFINDSAWANTQYDVFGKNVTRFLQTLSTGNPHLNQSEEEVFEKLGYSAEDLPEGAKAREVHAENLRTAMGQDLGVDLSNVSTSIMLDSIEYHLFPNACFFPGIQIPLIYRFRPTSVGTCIHEILILQPIPDGGERPAPAKAQKLSIEESYTTIEGFDLAYVLDQDTENFRRQWAGMNASLKTGQTLGNYQEVRIRNFHNTLDEYMAG
jgi:phenylpropionate dioxygenase-like ring-hydroxylating dioxygenase large terminal subunit